MGTATVIWLATAAVVTAVAIWNARFWRRSARWWCSRVADWRDIAEERAAAAEAVLDILEEKNTIVENLLEHLVARGDPNAAGVLAAVQAHGRLQDLKPYTNRGN